MQDKRFNELLEEYGQARGQAKSDRQLKKIEDTLWNEFGVEQAVFVLDMSGFSRVTQKHGLVHYLSMVRRMQTLVSPIVARYGGSVVKFEADNCFARFTSVLGAIQAGVATNHALEGMNLMTFDNLDVRVSIGIDFGRFCLVRKKDYFGDPVNFASKLGEDLATPGEILVSDHAMKQLAGKRAPSKKIKYSVSGLRITAHSMEY